jgi:hypothetical protein
MNFDDRGGLMAKFGQGFADCPPGPAMPPEYVGRFSGQEIAVEMPGSAGGESVESIARVASR